MRCEECKGKQWVDRWVYRNGVRLCRQFQPCPSCNGSGSTSCCEGMVGNGCDVTNTGLDEEDG